jgi:hypothetical protein
MQAGENIGGYRVLAPLNAGGLGDVPRAGNEKLGREVALMMLSGDVAGGAERLAPLKREAKVRASLNPANTAASFGFDTVESGAGERAKEPISSSWSRRNSRLADEHLPGIVGKSDNWRKIFI